MSATQTDTIHKLACPFNAEDLKYINEAMAKPHGKSLGKAVADLVHTLVQEERAYADGVKRFGKEYIDIQGPYHHGDREV